MQDSEKESKLELTAAIDSHQDRARNRENIHGALPSGLCRGLTQN